MKFYRFYFLRLKPQFGFFAYICFLLLCTACSTPPSNFSSGSVTPSLPMDDAKYQPVLGKWRKVVSNYKDLELNFKASAILISPEMEEAYKERLIEVHGTKAKVDHNIVSDNDKIVIVIDVFAKPDTFLDISDERLWNIELSMGAHSVVPYSINRYRNKEILNPFFPLSTQWSRHYVILFKLPTEVLKGGGVKDLFHKKDPQADLPPRKDDTIVFSMNSGEAQAKFSWEL